MLGEISYNSKSDDLWPILFSPGAYREYFLYTAEKDTVRLVFWAKMIQVAQQFSGSLDK